MSVCPFRLSTYFTLQSQRSDWTASFWCISLAVLFTEFFEIASEYYVVRRKILPSRLCRQSAVEKCLVDAAIWEKTSRNSARKAEVVKTNCERHNLPAPHMVGRRLLRIERNFYPSPAPLSGGQLPGKDADQGTLHLGVIITIAVIAFVVTKIFLGILLYWRWSQNRFICEVKVSGGKLVMFRSSGNGTPATRIILKKTQSLSSNDIIGSGGYGVVYRLVIDENTAFAVKKLPRGKVDQERAFERELQSLSDIKHRNIVSLRGYYTAPHVNLLIYDLMLNGSLEMILHDRLIDQPLDWPTRHSIALGTARGIAYLHHDCVPQILHRDIKSSNILLDENFEAHVSDFGLAKLLELSKSHVTTVVAGTLGYLSPEYLETGKATRQGDVFSYGIVLLELLTGRQPSDEMFVEKGINLVSWVKALVESGQAMDVIDDDLRGCCSEEDFKEALTIACQCVDFNPRSRPTMQRVVKMLERIDIDTDDIFEELSI